MMRKRRLIRRGLAHYWRTHLGVAAGAALGTAVLTGALVVGDSVRHTLHAHALARIGRVDLVLAGGDRFFLASLADRVEDAVAGARVGIAARPDGRRRARGVNVLGVDDRFFRLAPDAERAPGLDGPGALLDPRLAAHLRVGPGDEIVLRLEQPSALPRDSVLGTVQDMAVGLRVTVRGTVDDDQLGRFSLQADQLPPYNVFLPIDALRRELDLPDRANLLLVDAPDDVGTDDVNAAIAATFDLRDAQLELVAPAGVGETDGGPAGELRSDRIFLDPVVERAVTASGAAGQGVLTYFVNTIAHGERETPYSMVTAVGPLGPAGAGPSAMPLPADLADGEIVVNEWLADDLACGPGDELRLDFYVLDEDDRLAEASASFVVRSVVPRAGLAADRTLMPEFPGIADAEASRDWEPGIPIDLGRIRAKDEDWWDAHRGTPKAFVSLAAGKRMWANRYGALTAARFRPDDVPAVRRALHDDVDPAALGLFVRDVRDAALRASRSTTDFGGLFLGLSIFLIVAALLLTALLFVFNVEQRAR
ncbi:MAG: ABC transporter permease, partial [Planctomycetota bacterium]